MKYDNIGQNLNRARNEILEQWNTGITGIMGWWNDGFQIFNQHSIFPIFQLSAYCFPFSLSAANIFSGVIGNSLILTPTAS